ncbi:exported protein of unknown function [Methanoculleus bourgensis]|uniref:Uncharacterized protein n=1 Tax=Methanoculleus bourgensis TaxID=83986 RepID=A0A0X3BPS2_9EURY|nr:exported protein of unknown function [Methanoculleus bourgensis]
MTRSITLLALGLILAALVCSIPAGAVVTPLPGQGNQMEILFGVHPNAKTNETITAFIAEHGEIWWHESTYNHTHEYVYIVPANDCEEQLVYLNRIRADEHGGEQSIGQIWIIAAMRRCPWPRNSPSRRFLRSIRRSAMTAECGRTLRINPRAGTKSSRPGLLGRRSVSSTIRGFSRSTSSTSRAERSSPRRTSRKRTCRSTSPQQRRRPSPGSPRTPVSRISCYGPTMTPSSGRLRSGPVRRLMSCRSPRTRHPVIRPGRQHQGLERSLLFVVSEWVLFCVGSDDRGREQHGCERPARTGEVSHFVFRSVPNFEPECRVSCARSPPSGAAPVSGHVDPFLRRIDRTNRMS